MNKQINENTEEGFQDLEFNIKEYHIDENGYHKIIVEGFYKDESVSFIALFYPSMEPGLIDGEFNSSAFYPNGFLIRSIGKESDAFINSLSQLYGFKNKEQLIMASEIGFTCYCLEGNPHNFIDEPLKFKVFHDDTCVKGLYAELYINIDITNGLLEFKEKDNEYRKNIVWALSGKKLNIIVRLLKKILKKI